MTFLNFKVKFTLKNIKNYSLCKNFKPAKKINFNNCICMNVSNIKVKFSMAKINK